MLSKANSLSGTNPIKSCVNYAQLHKTLCIDLGYVEGKNILVEYRYAGGTSEDRIQGLVAEIMQLKVDVLVSPATSVIRAAKQATK